MADIYELEKWKIIVKHKSGPSEGKKFKLTISKVAPDGTETVLKTQDDATLDDNKKYELLYEAPKVEDAKPNYELVADIKFGDKKPVRLPETCTVWPRDLVVLTINEKGAKFSAFPLAVKQGSTRLMAAKTDAEGKSTIPLRKNTETLMLSTKVPYEIVKWASAGSKPRELKVEVKENLIPEFIDPLPAVQTPGFLARVFGATKKLDALVQMVNLAAADDKPRQGSEVLITAGFKADPDGKKGRKDDVIYVQAKFDRATKRNDPEPKIMAGEDASDIAPSDGKKTYKAKLTLKADDGQVKFKIDLGKAGGETCEIKLSSVKDVFDDSCPTLKFQNWRKIYYQVTRFAETTAPGMDEAKKAFAKSFIDFEADADSDQELAEADLPAGALVDAETLGRGGSGQKLIVGDHNVDKFTAKFQNSKTPTAHLILCDYQLDAKNKPISATIAVGNDEDKDKIGWPGSDEKVRGKKLVPKDLTNKPDNVLFFFKDLKDGTDAIKTASWKCVEDPSKTGDIDGDHVALTAKAVWVKLPDAASALIDEGNTVKIKLKLAFAKGWYAGWCTSPKRHLVIKVGSPDKEIAATILHECGHAISQTAKQADAAKFPGLTAPPHKRWYENARGHQGNHCAEGIDDAYYDVVTNRMDTAYAAGKCTCAMYGQTSRLVSENPKFCEKCQPYVQAVDVAEVTTS